MTSISERIGRFRVRSPLGKGGMGTLFLAWDPELERDVAIKLLYRDDEGLRERFLREARSAARLRHPNIVTVFDVGEHDGKPFIAMEYVPGETLARIIGERRAVDIGRRIQWMEELCDGLAYAHEAGIVHRDIKPANLMVGGDGVLKILDFGVARVAQATDLTQEGSLVGTLNYMSPEQVTGQDVDRRSDVFAVGAVLYEILSYRQAFPGSLSDGVLHDILHGEPEPLAREPSGIDAWLVSVVERAMSKNPENRYPDLVTMKADLQEIRGRLDHPAGDPVGPAGGSGGPVGAGAAVGSSESGPSPRLRSRTAVWAWMGVAAALVVLVPVGLMTLRGADPVEPSSSESPQAESTSAESASAESRPPEDASVTVSDTSQGLPPASPPAAPPPATVPPECARLLERASLGEQLTQDEADFLARRCRH